MTDKKFLSLVRKTIASTENRRDRSLHISRPLVAPVNVSIVWYAKILKNFKAIAVVDRSIGHNIYEITYNGDTDELYVDYYTKDVNFALEKASEMKI